jgi:Tfp pilus assembly protein FimT
MGLRSGASGSRGNTLGELLWVIVILSIVAAFAIPKLDWLGFRLNGETRNMTLQLAYAQRLAVSLQHNVQVTIDHSARELIIHEDANNDGAYATTERRRVVQLEPGVNFERNGVPDLPPPSSTPELLRILYRRDGTADRAGVIFINSDRGVRGRTNADARAIEVVRATGRGFWWRYLGGNWSRGS